jgi:hypothetical protein
MLNKEYIGERKALRKILYLRFNASLVEAHKPGLRCHEATAMHMRSINGLQANQTGIRVAQHNA